MATAPSPAVWKIKQEMTMAIEEHTTHTREHGKNGAENHHAPHKAKAASGHRAKTAKRHSHANGSSHIVNRLADSISLSDVTSGLDGLSEQLSDLKEKGLQTAKAVEQRMVKHPKSTVLLVFAAGYLWARLRRWL